MSRGQLVVLLVFLALTAGFAAVLLPELSRPPRPRPDDGDRSVARDVPSRAPARPVVAAPTASKAPPVPPSPDATVAVALEVVPADAAGPLGADLVRLVGATRLRTDGPGGPGGPAGGAPRIRRTATDVWVGAPGYRFARATDAVQAAVASGTPAQVRLERAGPAIVVVVVEADGTSAPDVPVLWPGPDGRPFARRTDRSGRIAIDDQPPGLVVVNVGGAERDGPTLRVVSGDDREARATLAPPFVVRGRVVDPEGFGVGGATVRARGPDGPGGRPVVTDADGSFRWVGRLTDRLALVASSGPREVAVEPPLPDPFGPLESTLDLLFPVIAPAVALRVDRRDLAAGALVRIAVEPAVLALVREAFSRFEVGVPPTERVDTGAAELVARADLRGPARVTIDGDVVAEDHLVPPAGPARTELRLVPQAAPPAFLPLPGSAPADAPSPGPAATSAASGPPRTGALSGRVVDAAGAPLPAVTVAAGGVRATTGTDGRFTLAGLPAGDRVEVVAGYVDGATAGGIDVRPFAPWASSDGRVGGEPVSVVLPRSAGVTFRAVRGIDGAPLAWVRAVVIDGAGEARFDGVLALRQGHGRLEGLVPGTAGTLHLYAPGLRRETGLALRAGAVVDVGEVSLVRGLRIEGTVKGPGDQPVAGATVAVIDDGRAETRGRQLARTREDALRRVVTDAQGSFVLEGLDPARPAGLAVFAADHAPTVRRAVAGEDGVGRLAVALVRGTSLRLRVEDKGGAAVPGAVVEIRDARAGVRWLDLWSRAAWGGFVGSDEDVVRATAALWTEDPAAPGIHRVGPLEPGPYEVMVACPGYKPTRAKYAVPDPTPGSADNPLRIPLDTMEWSVVLEPATVGPR